MGAWLLTDPVGKERIPRCYRTARSVRNAVPSIWLLAKSSPFVVVPIKRNKCGELHPAVTQFLVCVTIETTCIRSYHWYTIQTILEDPLDIKTKVLPQTEIVAQLGKKFALINDRTTCQSKN